MTSCKRRPSITAVSFLLIASHSREYQASAFSTLSLKRRRPSCSVPHAKRKNKRGDDSQDLNQWYDSVDDDATPDEVFWQEMERQRLFSDISKDQDSTRDPYAVAASGASSDMPMSGMNSGGTAGGAFNTAASVGGGNNGMYGGINPANMAPKRKPPNMDEQKAADATLSEYTLFQVEDNWLDERLIEQMEAMKVVREDEGDLSIEEETRRLEEQLEALPDGFGDQRELLMERNEPWDHFGDEEKEIEPGREGIRQVPEPTPDSEFYLDDDPVDPEEFQIQEAEFWKRMGKCQTKSIRLERAKASPKATKFFKRPPDASQGFDRLWVSAIDYVCFKSMVGMFRNYGVEFADNFGDFIDGCPEDGLYSIEDMASYKARKVYEATGLPCIASRTSFEIEPIPPDAVANVPGKAAASAGISNPKVLSGYKINDIGMHADYLCDALRPMSEPDRVTRFTSCICFYDGEIEILEHGICEVDLHFADSRRTHIPMSHAINNMAETLKYTFGLEYQKILRQRMEDALGGSVGSASLKLRDRVLKDGKVLPNSIIDVSKFMDSQVDVNLMDDCAKELANRFMHQKPTKIMTIATTGLVIALPMAKYLQVPVVYARKERNVVMADTFRANYASKTVGSNRELLVSKSHIDSKDRILVVDDFLSSGAAQEALLTIISDADATAVGIGVLLEKAYKCGRQSLSGFDIPIHSLCRVANVKEGSIQLLEEEGFSNTME